VVGKLPLAHFAKISNRCEYPQREDGMTAPTATKTWNVEIDPTTGQTQVIDPVTHRPVSATLTLKVDEEAAWTCLSNGVELDFKLTWTDESKAPPSNRIHHHSWNTGKRNRHNFKRSHLQLAKVEKYKYTVTVFDKNGSVKVELDPDMVMDT
jgi:hypothetical protein